MTLYTDNEGTYFQILPFTMKRKTFLRILEKARHQRLLRYKRNNKQEKLFFGEDSHVKVFIKGNWYSIAAVYFSNGTQWDYINGIRNLYKEFDPRIFKIDLKRIWKRYKQLGTEEYIRQAQKRIVRQQTNIQQLNINI